MSASRNRRDIAAAAPVGTPPLPGPAPRVSRHAHGRAAIPRPAGCIPPEPLGRQGGCARWGARGRPECPAERPCAGCEARPAARYEQRQSGRPWFPAGGRQSSRAGRRRALCLIICKECATDREPGWVARPHLPTRAGIARRERRERWRPQPPTRLPAATPCNRFCLLPACAENCTEREPVCYRETYISLPNRALAPQPAPLLLVNIAHQR